MKSVILPKNLDTIFKRDFIMTQTNRNTPQAIVEHCTTNLQSIGQHSHSALTQLESIFKAIIAAANAKDSMQMSDIAELAKAGEYLAMDQANIIDGMREQLIDEIDRYAVKSEPVESLDMLELAKRGCKGLEITKAHAVDFALSTNYLIESLSRFTVESTFEGQVSESTALSVAGASELIGFVAGLNTHINDLAR
jgi:hypothetical protein